MLKTNAMRFVSPFVVLALCTALIPGASAADSDSKSTPYGTMNAYLSIGYDDQHGVDVTAFLQTDIDSSVTMKKITHKIEAQYQDTGDTIRMMNLHPRYSDLQGETIRGLSGWR